MDVYALEAGPAMDALVAVHVLCWTPVDQPELGIRCYVRPNGVTVNPFNIPPYSTDIAAAWEVVDYLRDLWTAATAHCTPHNMGFTPPFDDGAFFDILHRAADRRWPWAFLYITPLAICRAALRVLEPKEAEDPI